MPLSPTEQELAQQLLSKLVSEKYKSYNYLFLQPFDLSQVPGYLDVVSKPLDLQTVQSNLTNNLTNNKYETFDAFWAELLATFENGVKYHTGKPTKWIAKAAKDMIKFANKERKASDPTLKNKPAGSGSLKIKLTKKKAPTQPATVAPGTPSVPGPVVSKPKLSLKLKLPTMAAAAAQGQATTAAAAFGTAVGGGQAAAATTTTLKQAPVKAKPTQPKLKLKLSLSKKLKAAAAAAAMPTLATATTAAPSTIASAATAPAVTAVPSSTKIQIKAAPGGGRGKELPKNVAAASVTGIKKKQKKKKATPTAATTGPAQKTNGNMAAVAKQQCLKVLAGLRRRQHVHIAWFAQPVSDKAILQDYKAKIPYPMDLTTLQTKLETGNSKDVPTFCRDLRRIFANCLRYNTSIKDSLRPVAVQVLQTADELVVQFLGRQGQAAGQYPPLLFCWKLCIEILDTLYNLVNPADGQPVALYFLHPVSYYCGGNFPPDYLQKIAKPMDFGTVTAELLEGRYHTVDEFCSDCKLVVTNCLKYYEGRDDGRLYTDQASRLRECLGRPLEQLVRYAKSIKGISDCSKIIQPLSRPPVGLLTDILQELRALTYTDKATKITEPATGPFEKPVSLVAFPDYNQFVQESMDLHAVERKATADLYETPEDFEYDMNLIFRNCETYNTHRNNMHSHFVSMAKFCLRQFRRLFYAKMRAYEDPSSVPPPKADRPESNQAVEGASGAGTPSPSSKSIKIEASGISKGKAPRISITAAQLSSAGQNAVRSSGAKSPGAARRPISQPQPKLNQPVPLHIAIARVKEAFPLRRAVKSLQPWEADCARYFKELMRHPWISAARPKFIFHVPVPTLFPELREAYAAKIRKQMDLTTVECTLLAGNRYAGPEDFVRDVALVFVNAIRFNKDGRDVGDPLSCAYYDASVHLLRYARWMSLELMSDHVEVNSHVDESTADGLPLFAWKLTTGNRDRGREEMDSLVLNEPFEKSLEGDRWTWHEAECEKLLKALRHQSDLRYMTFFIQPNYPADYTAFISKPMDWERVQRTLKRRHYDKFGNVIEDLRLIFSNALKYNARLKGTDTVSGRAYESAKYMSAKLEAAINKFMLSVSNRLEQERIDHANAEREIEAAERAEEAAIHAAWKKEPDQPGSAPSAMPVRSEAMQQKIRLVRRAQRRETADFEIPFFDEEDDGQHERSYFEVVKFQKAMFEKQRQELSKMRQATSGLGSSVFARLFQRNLAQSWAKQEAEKAKPTVAEPPAPPAIDEQAKNATQPGSANGANGASSVLSELERQDRGPLQVKLAAPKARRKKRKRPLLTLE